MVEPELYSAPRVALIVSHPVQYQAPVFRALSALMPVEVFFAHRLNTIDQTRAGFEDSDDWDVDLLHGYRAHYLRNVSRRPGVHRFNGCHTPGVYTVLRDGRFDCCLIFGWYLKSYLQAFMACRRLRIPVMMFSDSHEAVQPGGAPAVAMARCIDWVKRWMLRNVDGFCVPGSRARSYLQAHGVDSAKIHRVAHSVDAERLRVQSRCSDGKTAQLKKELGIGAKSRVVLCVAKLVPGKRIDDVVRATAALNHRGVDGGAHYHLLIVGSGAQAFALRTLSTRLGVSCTFAGFRNQRELPELYAVADVLVLASEHETWGLVVNEALACGVSAVVSDRAGCVPDLAWLTPRVQCYPCADVDGLADAIASITDVAGGDDMRCDSVTMQSFSPQTAARQIEYAVMRTVSRARWPITHFADTDAAPVAPQ